MQNTGILDPPNMHAPDPLADSNTDKAAILCAQDKAMLQEFSKKALARIIGRSFASAHLPFVSEYMDGNVAKEIEKDRLIITRAAGAFSEGLRSQDLDIDAIFESTKAVDKTFVRHLLIPSLSVTVKYEDIADIRKKRIGCLTNAVFTILSIWGSASSFEQAVQKAYTKTEFTEALAEILRLYSLETKKLTNSVHFLHPFNRAINFFGGAVFDAMVLTADELTASCATRIFGENDNG
jgi:hypothetical protein